MRTDEYTCSRCRKRRRWTLRFWQSLDRELAEKNMADATICPDCRKG